ncbi:sigma-70 family RNA polymerase sigma factor [Blastopirellula sp. JC732]|uniref:Sigma-70 family RNA polymerase sigma factor n=1 Tax=Blastopirellula sediminis TaxID=2894196 RepID=A0A9X1MHY0_9BACT|nr:sigma-70 family RNA polymerase sigma factor [Blastopirellula sediminis]MCC9607928.1 sigma-70 family RNA polymerase sigma factor [Blastopirellula sediminis]MCC9627279.1 sigma-70 family RNA polymerase sigma factor [Blastopirellula sediminis]
MSDEAALLEQISTGDVDALAKFIEARKPQLMAYIHRRLGAALKSKVEAEDIFQDSSVEAVRAITPEFPGDKDPFSWLCQIAERKIVDAHRHHFGAQKRDAGRERPLDGRPAGGGDNEIGLVNMLVKSMTTPSKAFSRNARELRLQAALAGLREEQREAIRLKYVEGWASKDIANQLGKTDAAIRVMLTRTLKQLQSVLAEQE